MDTQVRLLLEGDLLWKMEAIKDVLGVKSGSEVVRALITEKYRSLEEQKMVKPRYSIQDKTNDKINVVDALDGNMFVLRVNNDKSLFCEKDASSNCDHVKFTRKLLGVTEKQGVI